MSRSIFTEPHFNDEDFRYSNRVKLGTDDIARSERALAGVKGLMYRDSQTASI